MALPRSPINIPGSQINDLRLALNDVLATVKNGSAYTAAQDYFPLGGPDGKIDESWLPFSQTVLGFAYSTRSTILTTAAVIGYTDSVPAVSEGVEFMTVTYTPKSATSILRVRFTCPLCSFSGGHYSAIAALFRDGGASAIGASSKRALTFGDIATHQHDGPLELLAIAPSNGLISTTFKIRVGVSAGGGSSFNGGFDGAHKFGASLNSILSVEELRT